MVEHWKSTGRYWCKHCKVYVRDSSMERARHEATGKHKGALKRFLRDVVHTQHHKEREREKAKTDQAKAGGPAPGIKGSAVGQTSTNAPAPVRLPAPKAVPISSYGSQTSTSSHKDKVTKARGSTGPKKI